jgi:hypothetical protein
MQVLQQANTFINSLNDYKNYKKKFKITSFKIKNNYTYQLRLVALN